MDQPESRGGRPGRRSINSDDSPAGAGLACLSHHILVHSALDFNAEFIVADRFVGTFYMVVDLELAVGLGGVASVFSRTTTRSTSW